MAQERIDTEKPIYPHLSSRERLPQSRDPIATTSPNARLDIAQEMTADLEAVRHPSDGGGSAWVEAKHDASTSATVQTPGSWTLVYEAGPLGVAVEGMIFFQASPFWGWSAAQVRDPRAPGYTEVSTDAEGVLLSPAELGQGLLGVGVEGRRLEQGERVRIVYGAGSTGALADRFAERNSRFWIGVDAASTRRTARGSCFALRWAGVRWAR